MDFLTLLKNQDYILLDGAMGTMLQGKGMPRASCRRR